MPRVPLHALIWSRDQNCYALYRQAHLLQQVHQPGDEGTWLSWLREVSSFAFHGVSGSLNVYLEARSPRGLYWYAYHTSRGRTHKRYLGQTENLSLARLEETARALGTEPEVARVLDQGMTLLSSQLVPPRRPTALVERERLLIRLDEALSTPLTLVSAPAGFGKTTLLLDWASRRKSQVAWLSLEELDNTPTRFWVALIAALRRGPWGAAHLGETSVALLQSPQPPPLSSLLTALLQELESCEVSPSFLVLILDDYQVIEEQAIHEGLTFWVEHQPAHLHLLLASRVDPGLPLARWRARGQLTEIRADELRFQEGEASQYLGHMLSSTLTKAEVRRVVSRTEGWIAGLQLTALALQKREDRAAFLQALTGSQRYLLDYVQEEILAHLSANVRDFLLHCAILSRLDASVCQVVTAAPTQAGSQQMLVLLDRANLFLMPLDEERHSYRLHELFREALLATLHTTQPEMEPILHRRAARFYEAQGYWLEAITHWLAAADFSTAARLMEQTIEQFWLHGGAATIATWVLALPDQQARVHARLLLTAAFYLFNTIPQTTHEQRGRVFQQVRQLIARVETSLQANETDNQVPVTDAGVAAVSPRENREAREALEVRLTFRLRLLHLSLAVSEAASTGAYERLSAMQQEIEEVDARDEEAIWQMVPLWASFLLHDTVRREGARLVPRLLEAKEQVNWSKSFYASIRIRQYLALAALEAGQLRLAYKESQAALDRIEQMTGSALLKGYFESVLARVLYQWNRLEEAQSWLQTLLHEASAWRQLDLLGRGYAELLQVAIVRGEWSLAEFALHEVEHLVQHEHYGTYPSWLPALRADLWLAQGQLEAASDWAASIVFPEGDWERGAYDAFPVVMRVYFAERRWTEAVEWLEHWQTHLDRATNIAITITFLAQSLVALHYAGRGEQARRVAARLLALTEPEGYLRVYLDEGEPMREALLALLTPHSRQHELASSTTAYLSKLLTAFEQEQPSVSTSLVVPTSEPASSLVRQASALSSARGASLTRREQEVLRLLAAGASNQDIAQTLVIELATVKKHVSNLLGKLGVTSRTQAVALARTRSLL